MHTLSAILLMAFVTYLIRALPMLLINKPIESLFIRSILHYIPYAILASMTVPYIFYATGNPLSATAGTVTALILAWYNRSLITVSMISVVVAFAFECLL